MEKHPKLLTNDRKYFNIQHFIFQRQTRFVHTIARASMNWYIGKTRTRHSFKNMRKTSLTNCEFKQCCNLPASSRTNCKRKFIISIMAKQPLSNTACISSKASIKVIQKSNWNIRTIITLCSFVDSVVECYSWQPTVWFLLEFFLIFSLQTSLLLRIQNDLWHQSHFLHDFILSKQVVWVACENVSIYGILASLHRKSSMTVWMFFLFT